MDKINKMDIIIFGAVATSVIGVLSILGKHK